MRRQVQWFRNSYEWRSDSAERCYDKTQLTLDLWTCDFKRNSFKPAELSDTVNVRRVSLPFPNVRSNLETAV